MITAAQRHPAAVLLPRIWGMTVPERGALSRFVADFLAFPALHVIPRLF
jgi:hypothetical protein